jgi:hypothetical protein
MYADDCMHVSLCVDGAGFAACAQWPGLAEGHLLCVMVCCGVHGQVVCTVFVWPACGTVLCGLNFVSFYVDQPVAVLF